MVWIVAVGIVVLGAIACVSPAPKARTPQAAPTTRSSPTTHPLPNPTQEQMDAAARELAALGESGDTGAAGELYTLMVAAFPNCKFAEWHGKTTEAKMVDAVKETRVKYPKAILAYSVKESGWGQLLEALCGPIPKGQPRSK